MNRVYREIKYKDGVFSLERTFNLESLPNQSLYDNYDPKKLMFDYLEKGTVDDYIRWIAGAINNSSSTVESYNSSELENIYLAKEGITILPLFGEKARKIEMIIVPELTKEIRYISNGDPRDTFSFFSDINLYFMKNFSRPSNNGQHNQIIVYKNTLSGLKEKIKNKTYFQTILKEWEIKFGEKFKEI